MKGIVFLGNKKLELQNFDDPTPGPDEVILEIQASGMCGSDLNFIELMQALLPWDLVVTINL